MWPQLQLRSIVCNAAAFCLGFSGFVVHHVPSLVSLSPPPHHPTKRMRPARTRTEPNGDGDIDLFHVSVSAAVPGDTALVSACFVVPSVGLYQRWVSNSPLREA